jgi:hypothetical protein
MHRLSALILSLALCSPAYAQSARDVPPEVANACMGDYLRFCRAVVPGEGRVAQCFLGNRDQVSPSCKAALRSYEARTGATVPR